MKRLQRIFPVFILAVVVLAAFAISAGATELKTGIGIVQTNGLRLRAKPSTDADILASATYGDNVVIIRQVDDWYLVDYNLEIGYMNAAYITFKERENVDLGYGKINTACVYLREAPSADSDALAEAPYEETAYIIGFNCGWYKVQYEGQIGYMRSDLLELTERPRYNAVSSSYVSVAGQLVSYAKNYLGTPYVWGGTTTSGFDCSGYTKYVYKQFGVGLNRTAAQQLNNGYKVSDSSLEPGDLVFFAGTYAGAGAASHVGIYIGNGQFIHSAGSGVKITDLSNTFYANHYIGARRIF